MSDLMYQMVLDLTTQVLELKNELKLEKDARSKAEIDVSNMQIIIGDYEVITDECYGELTNLTTHVTSLEKERDEAKAKQKLEKDAKNKAKTELKWMQKINADYQAIIDDQLYELGDLSNQIAHLKEELPILRKS